MPADGVIGFSKKLRTELYASHLGFRTGRQINATFPGQVEKYLMKTQKETTITVCLKAGTPQHKAKIRLFLDSLDQILIAILLHHIPEPVLRFPIFCCWTRSEMFSIADTSSLFAIR